MPLTEVVSLILFNDTAMREAGSRQHSSGLRSFCGMPGPFPSKSDGIQTLNTCVGTAFVVQAIKQYGETKMKKINKLSVWLYFSTIR
jgi:hypothetical protein